MKHLICAVLFVTLGGCTATQNVRSPASDLHERLAGSTVQIHLLDGREERGRITRIRSDSTQWVARDGTARTEATSKIHAFEIVHRRGTAARGAAYGAAIGLPLAALSYAVTEANNAVFSALGSDEGQRAGTQAVGLVVGSSLVGAMIGMLVGRSERWVVNERTERQ